MEFPRVLNGKAEMVGFSCFLGGSDQLVGRQIARLSSLEVVMLSEVLSPGFDLNSAIVRNVLRSWIALGDVAVLWITQPLALSTASVLNSYVSNVSVRLTSHQQLDTFHSSCQF